MGAVYEKMQADLKLRRYSPRTEKSYLYYAARFVRHFGRSPAEMGKTEIRQFLLALQERGESAREPEAVRREHPVPVRRHPRAARRRWSTSPGRAWCRSCPPWSAAPRSRPCSARSSRWSAAWSS